MSFRRERFSIGWSHHPFLLSLALLHLCSIVSDAFTPYKRLALPRIGIRQATYLPREINGDYRKANPDLLKQETEQQAVNSDKPKERPNIILDLDDDSDEEEEVPDDLCNPVCRVVALSDGKIPTSEAVLPKSLFEGPNMLRRLDDIYHSMAHDETRRLRYLKSSYGSNKVREMESLNGNMVSYKYDPHEEKTLLSVARTSLEDAGFELMSRRDLDLCEALNAGYLLRLSILPDVSRLDPSISKEFYPERFDRKGKVLDGAEELLFEGRVLVFWRGYSQEVTRGRLLLPKLDYLQASLVQRSAAWVKAKLDTVERFIALKSIQGYRKIKRAFIRTANAVADLLPSERAAKALKSELRSNSATAMALDAVKTKAQGKIFKLARYGGSKIRFVGSPNPTDALTPFMICEQEDSCPVNPSKFSFEKIELNGRDVDHDIYNSMNRDDLRCPYDEELSVGANSILPVQLLERVSISNLVDFFSLEGRQKLLQKFFMKSELVEPTYEEVVVVWRPLPEQPPKKPVIRPPKFLYDVADMFDIEGLPEPPGPEPEPSPQPIEVRAFAGVPMANLPAVLPKTKLVFRPADAFVFDLASVVSFVLVIGSQKFDNPGLDLLALVSVSLWLIRTVIRYSNKLARYDLLVKTFLTSKISHRNAGALKYIATEAGSQRATRAALVHQWLRNRKTDSVDRTELLREGRMQVNELVEGDKLIRIDIDAALNDLEDLGLITCENGKVSVVSDSTSAIGALKEAWNDIFAGRLSLKTLVGRRRRRIVVGEVED